MREELGLGQHCVTNTANVGSIPTSRSFEEGTIK